MSEISPVMIQQFCEVGQEVGSCVLDQASKYKMELVLMTSVAVAGIANFLRKRRMYAEDGDNIREFNQDWDMGTKHPEILEDVNEDLHYDKIHTNHRSIRGGRMRRWLGNGESYKNTGKHGHYDDDDTHYPL